AEISNNPAVFKDNYRGWVNNNPNFPKNKNGGPHLQEIPLFESYLLRYLAKMAFLIERSSSLREDRLLVERNRKIIDFVEINGWEKWYSRGEKKSAGCYTYLFRNRTHMTSHWAIVALYLAE